MKQSNKVYRNPRFFKFRPSFLAVALAALVACGEKESSGVNSGLYTCPKLAGNYIEYIGLSATMTINADCTFTDSYCGYTARLEFPDSTSGNVGVNIIGTNGAPGCMQSITHACRMESAGLLLGIDCPTHQFTFSRIL